MSIKDQISREIALHRETLNNNLGKLADIVDAPLPTSGAPAQSSPAALSRLCAGQRVVRSSE